MFDGAKPFEHFGKGSRAEQFCKVWRKLDELFKRRCHLKELLTTDDAQRAITIAHLEHFFLRRDKKKYGSQGEQILSFLRSLSTL